MTEKPNVLVVICDDLGVGDLSSAGNGIVRTPVLDRFRSEAVDFGRHISGPLCSPARAALMTGQYAQRGRVIDTYCGRSMLDPASGVLPEWFRAAGYRTGCFGKWHLGDNCPFRPVDRGFDESLVHGSGGVGQPGDHPANAGRESYFDPWLWANGEERHCQGFCTDVFADATADFIEREKDGPWFAYLAFNAPHTPLQAPAAAIEACRERGASGDLAALYALVEGIDAAFGRVLDRLEATGQREDTIIHFTSDHGPCPGVAVPEGCERFDGGLRGQKGHVYEGGARVPAFWQWPARWQPGAVADSSTHVIDVAPTLAEACGLEASNRFDGRSLLPMLEGAEPDPAWRERTLFLQWHRGDRPVRFRNAAAWRGDWKWLRVSEAGPDELYDLADDPGESRNLAETDPECCAELREAYSQWFDDVGAPHDYEPLRIRIGDTREPVSLLSRQDWRVRGADGWSSDHVGWWPVEVAEAGRYRVDFVLDPADAPEERGTVVLKAAGREYPLEARPGETDCGFLIELPAGASEMEGRFSSRFHQAAPLYLRVSRAGG